MWNGIEIISVNMDGSEDRLVLPLEISADNMDEARVISEHIFSVLTASDIYPLIVTQDRWNAHQGMMKARILAHLEIFKPIYARNCEIRRIDKTTAREFLENNHSYGHASCRHCYGMFLKRHTGHVAQSASTPPGTLVAVATFSNARKWAKGDKTIRSYEWTRYASLADIRVSGGMGRMLKTFIDDIQPDDIMSYADLEWSAGEVYAQLGFELEGRKDPVMFGIDTKTWERYPTRVETTWNRYFQNFGSNKYRLKLTDYK